MIRQTITCDACGIERKEVNHWFEAYEHEGELRIRGLVPSKTTKPGLRHLCGQTCLHRLVDDFMAGNLSSRMFGGHDETKSAIDFAQLAAQAEKSIGDPDLSEFESSARLVDATVVKAKPVPRTSSVTRKEPSPAYQKHRVASVNTASLASSPVKPKSGAASRRSPSAVPPADIPPATVRTSPTASSALAASERITARPDAPIPPPVLRMPAPSGAADSRPQPASTRLDSAASATTAFVEPSYTMTPQMRRSQAWERERAREKQAAERQARDKKLQKLI